MCSCLLLFIILYALPVAACVYIVLTEEDNKRNFRQWVIVMLCIFVPILNIAAAITSFDNLGER